MRSEFAFDRRWAFDASPAELWQTLSRAEQFPRWWSWLRRFDGDGLSDGLEEGARARCVVRGPVPYTLRFTVTVRRLVPRELIETDVTGDLEGPARLEILPDGSGSRARLAWTVELRDPLLRAASRFARPLMEWGHDWVVSAGLRQFRREALGERGA